MSDTSWIEESELTFDFSDEAINAILDMRGLRKLFSGGYLFDAESTRAEYAEAVKTGMANWAKEFCV